MITVVNRDKELPFKERLIEEYLVLESRLILLKSFIKENPTFKEFSFRYKRYLRCQYFAMCLYFKYLKKRMMHLSISKVIIDMYITEEQAKKNIVTDTKKVEKETKKLQSKKTNKNDKNKKD